LGESNATKEAISVKSSLMDTLSQGIIKRIKAYDVKFDSVDLK